MAIDYTDHDLILKLLTESQDDDSDNRERAREAHHFLDKRDGQWEPSIIKNMTGRPRYTFDKCNPIVDDIAGEMEGSDFDIRVRPAGGDATKDLAKTIDGLVRNIETMSNAVNVYNAAGREMVASGIGGWEVVQDWAQTDSFDQDLFIRPIHNFEDRVWFDVGSELQDRSDARHLWILQNLTPDEYDDKFPEGSKQSIGDDRSSEVYTNKSDFITTGRIQYKQPIKKTLVQMSDGSVYEKTADFDKILNEKEEGGITVKKERVRDSHKVVSRIFDGGGWLTEPEDTVFTWLSIIPTYGNFKIRESKVIYRGAIEKLMDAQRVYNYARSRETEEVALSPRAKYWMTRKQAGNEANQLKLQTLNTNADPVQIYEPDDRVPGPPQQNGGSGVNPGLQQVTQNSLDDISTSAGRFAPQSGDVDGPLSGIAIQKLQNKGDNGNIKYFKSQEIAICHTGRIVVDALPRVHDIQKQVRILNEDDSFEIVTLQEQVFDQETQKMIVINDLTKGKYDVTCDVGPAFKNRQQESVKAMQELSTAIPGLAEITADIQMKNIPSPGMDLAAERVRRRLFEAGNIPETQMTDDEKQEIQQAKAQAQQQEGAQTPQDKIADAEVNRVQAETADIISKSEERAAKTDQQDTKLLLQEREQLLKAQDAAENRDIKELTLALKQQAQATADQQQLLEAQMKGQEAVIDNLNTQAQTLKLLREAMGVDTFTGPHTVESFVQQAEIITDQQDQIQATPETDSVTSDRISQSPDEQL